MSQQLAIGEKYLSISLLGSLNLAAFKNKNKSKPTDPDYSGNGIAIWIKEKTEAKPEITHENVL